MVFFASRTAINEPFMNCCVPFHSSVRVCCFSFVSQILFRFFSSLSLLSTNGNQVNGGKKWQNNCTLLRNIL